MDENSKKEEFSYAYIRALVASCGYIFNPSTRAEDNRGFDFSIIGDEVKNVGAPRIMVQAKCTTLKNFHEVQNVYKYDLKIKNYNKLRQQSIDPSILIIVLVPNEVEKWMLVDEVKNETLIKYNAYYVSLVGSPETTNKEKITISIPKQNLLTQKSLKQLMIDTSDLRKKIISIVNSLQQK